MHIKTPKRIHFISNSGTVPDYMTSLKVDLQERQMFRIGFHNVYMYAKRKTMTHIGSKN